MDEQQAMERFIDQARQATPEQRRQVIQRFESMIGRGECAVLPSGKVSLETMRATVAAIKAL